MTSYDLKITGGTVYDGDGNVIGGLAEGNRLASVPEYQVAASGVYEFPVNMFGATDGFVTATVHHVGDRITQPSDQVATAGNFVSGLAFAGASGDEVTAVDLELDPYTIVNLSAGIQAELWSAVLYIQNVGDENANLSFDRERGGRARLAYRTNSPRTIGLTFRRNFGN